MKKYVVGNWKMNGNLDALHEASNIADYYNGLEHHNIETALCVPSTLISSYAASLDIPIGGQDCHAQKTGAFTGDISAEMLRDAGAKYVIVGHSERRTAYGETNDNVRQKAEAAYGAGLKAIICVGESLQSYKAGQTADYVTEQITNSLPETATIENTLIAYEPIWAIGSGLTPTSQEIADIHQTIFDVLSQKKGADFAQNTPLLYGGSVNGGNAEMIAAIPHVHGGLVGGASLNASAFTPILDGFAEA